MKIQKKAYSTVQFFDYPVFKDKLDKIDATSKTLINTINLNSFVVAEQDLNFKKALIGSEILLPDGVGIVAATRILYGKKIKKIAGADLHEYLLRKLNKEKGSCFYLGSSQKTLDKIKERIKLEYPSIKVEFFSPKFKPAFTKEENQEMIDAVNAFHPDVVFVGMTAPKQEKWGYENKDALQTQVICSIGAVFDFYAKTIKRPSPIWISLGLEWFIRLIKEPKRMWRRYLYNGPIFFFLVFKMKFKGKA